MAFAQEEQGQAPSLLDIAEAEARKQHGRINAEIRSTLLQLGIYTDPALDFVQRKMQDIIAFGGHAVPLLVEAMENPSEERTPVNAGRMAAMILARIDDPRTAPELQRMLAGGNERAKINALHALGEFGEPAHLEVIAGLLESENIELKSQALICLGLMKAPGLLELAAPFFEAEETEIKLAAIKAFTHFNDPAAEALILPVLERTKQLPEIQAAVGFLARHGTGAAVPILVTKYEKGNLRKKERWAIIDAVTAIGKRGDPRARDEITAFLKRHLDSPDNRTVKEVAFALNELGDDMGVKVRTRQLDRLISKHSSAEYYFRRGEIYLEFKKYKQAARDFNEGLRKDRKGGRYGSRVFVSLARCYAAEERFADAERMLRKAELEDTTNLPKDYDEFHMMAGDDRYSRVFRPGWN
jgi:HEAT repeat protein